MGKKMKLPFLSKTSEAAAPSWPWPSCGNPKTLSFRSTGDILKTVNAAYVDTPAINVALCQGPTSQARCKTHFVDTSQEAKEQEYGSDTIERLTHSKILDRDGSEADCFWVETEEGDGEAVEAVVRGLRSDNRLFFEPGETSSILDEAKNDNFPFKESVAMVMDSEDPYIDFKKSMEEMVEAHGLKDWESVEELLNWYLRVNGKKNHGYIIKAFVDLLVGISFSFSLLSKNLPCSSSSCDEHEESMSLASPLSFSSCTFTTSPCLSSLELVEDEVEKQVDIDGS